MDEVDEGGEAGLMIFSEHRDDSVCVQLWGDLDAVSAPDLGRELDHIAREVARHDRTANRVVEIDARGLTFIDSAGLRALDEGRRAVRRSGGRFRLVAGEALRRLAVLSGLSDLLVDR